jgi:hypothetical protein
MQLIIFILVSYLACMAFVAVFEAVVETITRRK